MADVKERKRVTLHPLKEDGTMDLEINLYPKTLVNGIVDSDGNEVDITTQAELDDAINTINAELEEKTTDIDDIRQNILYVESNVLAAKQDIADIQEELETKASIFELNLDTYISEESRNSLKAFIDNNKDIYEWQNWEHYLGQLLPDIENCDVLKCKFSAIDLPSFNVYDPDWSIPDFYERVAPSEESDGHVAYSISRFEQDGHNLVKYEFYPTIEDIDEGSEQKAGTPTWTEWFKVDGEEEEVSLDYIKLAENNQSFTIYFNLPANYRGSIYLNAIMDNWNSADNQQAKYYRSETERDRMYLELNGNELYPDEKYERIPYITWLSSDERELDDGNANPYSYEGYCPWIAYFDEFNAGQNSITFVRQESRSLLIKSITLVLEEIPEEEHYVETELLFTKTDSNNNYVNFSNIIASDYFNVNISLHKNIISYDSDIIALKTNTELSIPTPNYDEDNGKALVYNDDKWALEYKSFQAPINDLNQIRAAAYDYQQNGASKSYVKSKISDFKASENYWTAAQHFSAPLYAGTAYINTLYGSNNVSKPVSQIALLSDIPSLSEYATVSALSSAIFGLSSVYAPAGNYADVEDLASKQDFPAIEYEYESLRLSTPIFSYEQLKEALETFDSEFIRYLIQGPDYGEEMSDVTFHQYMDNFGEVWTFYPTSENSADVDVTNGSIIHKTSVEIFVDAETGDSHLEVGEDLSTDIDEKLTNLSETKQDALVRNPIVVTNENRASISQDIISMLEDIALAADGDNSKHYDVTYRFNGAEADSVAMRAIWGSFEEESETIKKLTYEMDCRRFQILTNGSYTLDYDAEYGNYIRTSFDLKISIETDAETGDSRVVVGPCPRIFGDVRFVYDYEPPVEEGN